MEIEEYLVQCRQAGLSDNQIKQNLIGAGWAESDVDHVLGVSTDQLPIDSQSQSQADPTTDNVTKVLGIGQKVTVAIGIYDIVKNIGGMIVLIVCSVGVYFYLTDTMHIVLPSFVIPFALLVMIILIIGTVLQVIITKKMASANLSSTIEQGPPATRIEIQVGEQLQGAFAGITRIMDAKSIFKLRAGPRGGAFGSMTQVGEIYQSENSMLVTNDQIILLTVPMPGADTLLSNGQGDGMDIGMGEWLLAKKQMQAKLDQMINTETLAEVANCHPHNFAIDRKTVSSIVFVRKGMAIQINLTDGKRFTYWFREKADAQRAQALFNAPLA